MNDFPVAPPQDRILRQLNEQRLTGQFCDVRIRLNNPDFQVWAHFCVIAPQSDFVGSKYFQQQDMQFSIHNPLTIRVCRFECEECLCDVLAYMYGEDVTILGAEHEQHIRHLGKLLSIQELTKLLNRAAVTAAADEPSVVVGPADVTDDIILQVEDCGRPLDGSGSGSETIVQQRRSGFQYKCINNLKN